MIFSESLKKNKDFQIVYRNGRSCANRLLVMYVHPNGREKNRIGISVSKKVGNSVVRHRLTRLIRDYRSIESALIHLGKLHKIVSAEPEKSADADTAI